MLLLLLHNSSLLLPQLNVVYFRVAGLGLFNGSLSIKASYEVESEQRVSIKFIESTLVSQTWLVGWSCGGGVGGRYEDGGRAGGNVLSGPMQPSRDVQGCRLPQHSHSTC